MNGKSEKIYCAHLLNRDLKIVSLFRKTIRYGIAVGCVGLVLFWSAKEPPVLDMKQMQVADGVYQCLLQAGGKRGGPSGPDIVDGVIYHHDFSYIFGVHAPGACFRELNGRAIRITYLLPINIQQRLALEVLDIQSGRIFGIRKEQKFALYQQQVDNKFIFYLSKFGLILLALLLICGTRLNASFQQSLNKLKNHDRDR